MDFFGHRHIRVISDTLKQHRFKVLIVGGAVRDAVMGRPHNDLDILTDAPAHKLKEIFSTQKARIVGRTFPVCLVNHVEITPGHGGTSGFPDTDLARRDFTFNAMAWDPEKQVLLDPFNGKKDIEERVVRFTGEPESRIKEDPLRMVRACRFAAMLEGGMDKESFEAICSLGPVMEKKIAPERVRMEVVKAMGLARPSLFFAALQKTGLLAGIFPSLDRCYGLSGGPYHGETVFEHCLLVGDALPENKPMLRLAGFLHDTGKFDKAKIVDGRLTFKGHETAFHNSVKDLETLRFSKNEIAYISALFRSHMRPLTDESSPKAVRRLLCMLEDSGLEYRDFMRMRIADRKGNLAKPPYTFGEIRDRLAKIFTEKNAKNAFALKDLKISGNEIIRILKLDPGPEVGRIKAGLFEAVLENPDLNNPDELRRLCRSLKTEK